MLHGEAERNGKWASGKSLALFNKLSKLLAEYKPIAEEIERYLSQDIEEGKSVEEVGGMMDTDERLRKLEQEMVELRKSFEIIWLNLLENSQPLQTVGKSMTEVDLKDLTPLPWYRVTFKRGEYGDQQEHLDLRAYSEEAARNEAGRAIPFSARILKCELLE